MGNASAVGDQTELGGSDYFTVSKFGAETIAIPTTGAFLHEDRELGEVLPREVLFSLALETRKNLKRQPKGALNQ